MAETHPRTPIVVAVDASLESLAALEWAIDYASTRGHRLRVVTAVRPANTPSSDSARSHWLAHDDEVKRAQNRVRSLTLGPLTRAGIDFEHVVALGAVDRVLARNSSDALFAVVGSAPAVGWRRYFRRSAAKRLTARLSCPVVAINNWPASQTPRRDWVYQKPEQPETVQEQTRTLVAA